MGWITTNKPSYMSVREFLQEEDMGAKLQIIEFASKKFGKVAYGAVRNLETGEVFGVVWLLAYNCEDGHNFGWKTMDETMGPNEDECPEKILKLLSPTEYEYANHWRDRCWKNINLKKKVPKLKDGDVIKFARPITFTNGVVEDTFTVCKEGRKVAFKRVGRWQQYSISQWRQRDFEVLKEVTING